MKFRCSNCSYVFSVELGGPAAAPNRPAVSTGEPPSRLGNRVTRVPPGEPVRLLQSQGVIFEVPDLATLQRWILEQRLLRNDLLSLHGLRWQQAGDRPDLELFFNAAESMQGTPRRRERPNLGRDLDVVPMDESLGDGTSEPTVVDRPEAADAANDGRIGRVNTTDPVEVSSTELQPLGRSVPKITPRPRLRPGQELGPVLPPLVPNPDDSDLGTIPAPSADTEVDTAESAQPPPHPSRLPPPPPPRPDLGPTPVMTATPLVVPPVEYGPADGGQEVEEVAPEGGNFIRSVIVAAIAFAVVFIVGMFALLYTRNAEDEPVVVNPPVNQVAPVDAAAPVDPAVAATAPAPAAGAAPAAAAPVPAPPPAPVATTPAPAPAPAVATAPAASSPAASKPAAPKPAATPSAGSLTKQGWSAVDSGQFQKAYDLFDRAAQAKSNSAEALYGRGYSSEKLGDKTSAKSDYCRALEGSGAESVVAEVNGRLRALGLSCP